MLWGIKYTKLKRQPATDSFPVEKKQLKKGEGGQGCLAPGVLRMQLNKATAPRSGARTDFIALK